MTRPGIARPAPAQTSWQDRDIRAVEVPFRAHPADLGKARRAVADRTDVEHAVAGVAHHEVALRAVEVVAAADKLPFRADRAAVGKGEFAVDHLADPEQAARDRAGVAHQKPGVPVAEKIADPLELPLRAEPADAGKARRPAHHLADIDLAARNTAGVSHQKPGAPVAEKVTRAGKLPFRAHPTDPGKA